MTTTELVADMNTPDYFSECTLTWVSLKKKKEKDLFFRHFLYKTYVPFRAEKKKEHKKALH